METAYIIDKNTAITPKELERLEDLLKKNISYKFKIVEEKNKDFFLILKPIRFSKIWDGTLK